MSDELFIEDELANQEDAEQLIAEEPVTEEAKELTPAEQEKALLDAAFKTARLLNRRAAAMEEVREKTVEKNAELVRALKLLDLKPQMEQAEMADILHLRLRVLDHDMELLEQAGAVERVLPEEPDMRIVKVSVTDAGRALAAVENPSIVKGESFIPALTDEAIEKFQRMLNQVAAALEATGLSDDDRRDRDRDRGGRGGDRGGRDRDRGGRGGFRGDRGGNRDYRNYKDGGRSARYDNNDRGGRGNRGGRGGFGGSDRGGNR